MGICVGEVVRAVRLYPIPLLIFATGLAVWTAPVYREDKQTRSMVLPHNEIAARTRKLVEGTALVYVSDYFSFVGSDAQGYVAFALDNNRGRDGESYQAEHFLVLHDEKKGWIDIKGKGFYDNAQKQLYEIPDSPFFQFIGNTQSGFVIKGKQDNLRLETQALIARETRGNDERLFSMGSAAAVFYWEERTIPGRVIYEYLVMKNANRLSRRLNLSMLFGGADFQGLYLRGRADDDFYFHGSHSAFIQPLTGPILGFSILDGQQEPAMEMQIEVTVQTMAFGLFRWPTAWKVTWKGEKGPAVLMVREGERKPIVNWLLGGFAMSIVSGELQYGGKKIDVYGFGEIIR